ncbi:hypothetical protein QYE76_043207 [Lolium multiflorum]|uniref:RING-type domain-containing protein n=1 Tax=Lolium multiflorum TaxID=4521 RepID=A0AAD8TGQ2_LOLMU|nr:hypothetical protein QYE76_043207 [Lolium multiflorum]
MIGWRGQAGPAPPYGVVAPSTLLRLFAYLKPPSRKPYYGRRNPQKPSRAAVIAKPRCGDGVLFRHLGAGKCPEGFSIDTAAIFTAIFITAAAPMRRSSSPSRLGAVPGCMEDIFDLSSICMLGLSQRTTVRLRGCKHPFHRKCIFSWFVTNASCPICRDKVLTHLIFDL